MSLARIGVLLGCLLLAACKGDDQQVASPREPGPDAIGFYCGMSIGEHQGPKGQMVTRGTAAPLWFSSVRDALTYVDMEVVGDRDIVGFWVNDMSKGSWEKPAPGSWIDARSAWYVVGSRMEAGMGGGEAVPFKERAAAELFAKDNGGKVVDFVEARRAIAAAVAVDQTEQGKS